MVKGVFIHNSDTHYDDVPEVQYHFPKQYLGRAEPFVGDWILYYKSGKSKNGKCYTALAKVSEIIRDRSSDGHYYALIEPNTYLPFERVVPFKSNGRIANSFLANPDGTVNRGKQVWAIRQIPDEDFYRIVDEAFPENLNTLPREDVHEVEESPQQVFVFDQERDRVETRFNRLKRDGVFRSKVLQAYDSRCAFTGLKFINGGGRAEVQAAHIKPVASRGPDSVNNGLALSGTVHWMFDRGLLSISDKYNILVSRHINDLDAIDHLLNNERSLILPQTREHWPHPRYLEWHRDECFKT